MRVPALVAVAVTQAVLFVVLFTFKGAIHTPGVAYVDYLMPGILVLAVAFGSPNTGVGLAEDLTTGMLDRFRSLPMTRPALLAGRTLVDAVRNLLVVLIMIGVGALIGFLFHAGPSPPRPRSPSPSPSATSCPGSLPSSASPPATPKPPAPPASCPSSPCRSPAPRSSRSTPCPAPSKPGADINPITHVVDAIRALILGGPTTTPLLQAFAWLTALTAIVVPSPCGATTTPPTDPVPRNDPRRTAGPSTDQSGSRAAPYPSPT